MKKTYTKKLIQEAIAYWEKLLDKLNENLTIISHNNINFVELLNKAHLMKSAVHAAYEQFNSTKKSEDYNNAETARKEYEAFLKKYQDQNIWFVENPSDHMPVTVLAGYGKLLKPAKSYDDYPFKVWDN